ncbi:hypothetical protein [Consotaella salsifontis]|uniref:hypothetical protein n=1 Tax=Consotaella salsifontis TaxID=1365950 RepID=UPI0013F67C59|nr:hypothetical protein [Consotaella salsifontis]
MDRLGESRHRRLIGAASAPAFADCSTSHTASIKKPVVTTDSSTRTMVDEKKS